MSHKRWGDNFQMLKGTLCISLKVNSTVISIFQKWGFVILKGNPEKKNSKSRWLLD